MKTLTPNKFTRFSVALALTVAAVLPLTQAQAQAVVQNFNIKAQPLAKALLDYSRQSNTTVVVANDIVSNKAAPEVRGNMTPEQALEKLLENSGLHYQRTEDGGITISSDSAINDSRLATSKPLAMVQQEDRRAPLTTQFNRQDGDKDEPANEDYFIEEIIITSRKRETTLQDTAQSVFVLGNEAISRKSLAGMGDYLNSVPGVSQQDYGAGFNQIVVRGISSESTEVTTTGVYFGEAPLTGVAEADSSYDIKLVDIERIEVLRGPQGTLYGAGSLGGTVRNIPMAPDLEEYSGTVTLGYSNTADTGGDNYKAVGIFNAPLIEGYLALRLVAYHYDNDGFVDVVSASDATRSAQAAAFGASVVNEKGVGGVEYQGGRASLLWVPTDNLDITLMHLEQTVEQDGLQQLDISLGGYRTRPFDTDTALGSKEFQTDDMRLTNLVVEYDLQWANLLSSSTWIKADKDFARDIGRLTTIPFTTIPLPAVQMLDFGREGFTQELRLASQWSEPLQFTSGVYYEEFDRHTIGVTNWIGSLASLQELGVNNPRDLFNSNLDYDVQQTAVFAEVSYDITDRLTTIIGGRWFDYDREDAFVISGPIAGGFRSTGGETSETGTTFKINTAYNLSDDALVYAEWAQGFRLGRPSFEIPEFCNDNGKLVGTNAPFSPGDVESDELDSYELGSKFTLFNGRLVVNSAVYHIRWEGIPVTVNSPCGFGVVVNAGEARSRGAEFEMNVSLSKSLRTNIGLSYVDAELSKANEVLGPKGTRLPGSSDFSATIGVEYDFVIAAYPSFVRADYTYIDGFRNDITGTFPEAGDYGKLNMRIGTTVQHIDIALYGNNLTNSDELTFVDTLENLGHRLTPRTIGVDVSYRF